MLPYPLLAASCLGAVGAWRLAGLCLLHSACKFSTDLAVPSATFILPNGGEAGIKFLQRKSCVSMSSPRVSRSKAFCVPVSMVIFSRVFSIQFAFTNVPTSWPELLPLSHGLLYLAGFPDRTDRIILCVLKGDLLA